jgi:hypothetical protein
MKIEIQAITTMCCKIKSQLTRALGPRLASELEKNIMVRDNQSEENDVYNHIPVLQNY